MYWTGFLGALLIAWCGIDIGIAIPKKDIPAIVFNTIFIIVETLFILFAWGL
jgi:hypothetical protein